MKSRVHPVSRAAPPLYTLTDTTAVTSQIQKNEAENSVYSQYSHMLIALASFKKVQS